MSETVQVDGVTLYAPALACRPVRLEDYLPDRQHAYREVLAKVGVEPPIYPGSAFVACEDCGVEVVVGPRQQEVVALAAGVGLAAHVRCMLDAAERAAERGDVTPMHLGNPFERRAR